MSNFTFLPSVFKDIRSSSTRAEGYCRTDPRTACFHTRFTLETIVHWLYRHDTSLTMPYDEKLGALIYDPGFQNLIPEAVFQKMRVIHRLGNQAVHSSRPIHERDGMQVVRELFHICYWMVRTYTPDTLSEEPRWSEDSIPEPIDPQSLVPRKELEKLEQKLAEQNEAELRQQKQRDELDTELQQLREQLASIRQQREQVPDTHDYSESDTRRYLIDMDLRRAGWKLDQSKDHEYEVTGMPNEKGTGYVDYVLWGDDGKPLGLVEAKKTTKDPAVGKQQAKLYADCLEQMQGQRPVIFFTNGYETWMWDDTAYPARKVAGFYKKDELNRIILRRTQRRDLDVRNVKDTIVERYYQKRAIGSIFQQFSKSRRKALLVMATGTGKTRTSIALVDVLQRAGWIKRVLFLADRVSLVRQAVNAFKAHLPESSPVNLVTEKDTEGRVYVSTYPTMMGLIDQTRDQEAQFGVGHFDLVVIDEAHRSVYQKYGAIFRYFDSMLVGLTATPREEVDRNTYDLFDLEPGVPTDAYELDTAVRDGFLVPPKVQQVNLKFPREGINYDALSDKEKEQWESLDWGDEVEERGLPDKVNAAAINSWLFNKDTVDKVLKHLMEYGHKVSGGDRLVKTIIFARNHDHAVFIEQRFNHHYPHYAGNFARVVDHYATYAQSLIDDFSRLDQMPHIAISVDMLDTGIDIPEVANLVFFKPVYSKIKFWQMIGRGTRLCPDLFGPDQDKENFRVFDFCFNFDFFRENPDGIEASGAVPLGTRLFRNRVQLLHHLKKNKEDDEEQTLTGSLTDLLQGEVDAMNTDNFIVRMHREVVEKFQSKETWKNLQNDDYQILQQNIAELPSEREPEEIETRLFDLLAVNMQLSLVLSNTRQFESYRKRVTELAATLEEKSSIPAVRQQLVYLSQLQESEFWEGITLDILEEMRLRIRNLAPLLDKRNRKIVYTDFEDEITAVNEESPVTMPNMTGAQYEKKVREYLTRHQDDIVIYRLRSNQPLTEKDLQHLEETLVSIGKDDGTLLSDLLARTGVPSLAWFVRQLVGMDRAAAQQAFSVLLNDRSLTEKQIRFIELVIDQLTSRGVMEASALYEPPFSNIDVRGPEALFRDKKNVIDGIFQRLKDVTNNLDRKMG